MCASESCLYLSWQSRAPACVHLCMCACVCACMHVCVCMCAYHVGVCTCVCVSCMCLCVYACNCLCLYHACVCSCEVRSLQVSFQTLFLNYADNSEPGQSPHPHSHRPLGCLEPLPPHQHAWDHCGLDRGRSSCSWRWVCLPNALDQHAGSCSS